MAFVPLDERYSSRNQKGQMRNAVQTSSRPPAYDYSRPSAYDYVFDDNQRSGSRWNPKSWSKRCWMISAAVLVVVIIVVIIGAVVGEKANAYPSYTKLTYSLEDAYEGPSFFDNFDYFTGYDPSSGFVHYVDSTYAANYNLTYATSTSAVLKVLNTDAVDASTGRYSVRITSKKQYNSGLFLFDVAHSPYGCSTWPALWLTDPSNWPTNGEIDVMEAVNNANTGNQATLHTTKDCSMKVKRKETGHVKGSSCYNGTNGNEGCGVIGQDATFGPEFNANGGGVYAMEFRDAGIRVWFFPRSSSTATTLASNASSPDPSTWGEALADFPSTDCDISTHFRNQSIIANIDLCGDLAGLTQYYTTQAGCPGTCEDNVANNATGFDNAYWEFNSFKVYQAS